jgi:hypothetical protein
VGLSTKTIASCWYVADRFLTFRFDKDLDFGRIAPTDIVAFLQRQTGRKTPYRDKIQPTHLRNFFQYLSKEGLTAANRHVSSSWARSRSPSASRSLRATPLLDALGGSTASPVRPLSRSVGTPEIELER